MRSQSSINRIRSCNSANQGALYDFVLHLLGRSTVTESSHMRFGAAQPAAGRISFPTLRPHCLCAPASERFGLDADSLADQPEMCGSGDAGGRELSTEKLENSTGDPSGPSTFLTTSQTTDPAIYSRFMERKVVPYTPCLLQVQISGSLQDPNRPRQQLEVCDLG